MKILLTGGTGLLGRPLLARLREKGHECFVLSRSPQRFWGRPGGQGVTWLSYGDPLPEIQAVVHLAGESVAAYWTGRKKEQILQSRVKGTRWLVQKLSEQKNPPAIFLSASAVGWYGNRPAEILTEMSAPDPEKKFRWQVCAAWETAAEEAEKWGARVVLLRIGNVLDPAGGYLQALLLPWRFRLGIGLGSKHAKLSWIGLDDAVRLMEFALENDTLQGPLNVTSPHPVTQAELMTAMKKRFEPLISWRIPAWILRLVLGEFSQAVVDSQEVLPAKALAAGFRFEEDQVDDLLKNRRVLEHIKTEVEKGG